MRSLTEVESSRLILMVLDVEIRGGALSGDRVGLDRRDLRAGQTVVV